MIYMGYGMVPARILVRLVQVSGALVFSLPANIYHVMSKVESSTALLHRK